MSDWQRADPRVFTGNESGGDSQFTEGFTARWFRKITPGVDPIADTFPDEPSLWAVVDSTYYGTRDDGIPDHVEACFDVVVCTDLNHPGDTELLATAEYQHIADADDDPGECSDTRLRQYATDDDPPSDAWWNESMDTSYSSRSHHYYLAVTG